MVGVGAQARGDQVCVEGEPRLHGGVGELFEGFKDVTLEVAREGVGALVEREETRDDVTQVRSEWWESW